MEWQILFLRWRNISDEYPLSGKKVNIKIPDMKCAKWPNGRKNDASELIEMEFPRTPPPRLRPSEIPMNVYAHFTRSTIFS